jgi:hypothetical protein
VKKTKKEEVLEKIEKNAVKNDRGELISAIYRGDKKVHPK